MRRLLVTGRHGFVGTVLAQRLAVLGDRGWTLADIPITLDLRDRAATEALVAKSRPDAVIHLAAQSSVPEAERDPEGTIGVNVLGTLHLLQALDATGFRGRLLYVGTGDVYGLVDPASLPIDEGRLPRPRNPYAVSKLAAEALCWQWHARAGHDVVLARPFNHIGPGQSDRFAVSSFARQIALVKRGRHQGPLRVGNLDSTRDFTDVRDVADAYLGLLEHGVAGEIYNVCSGVEHTMRSVLERLIALAGVSVAIATDASRLRQGEQVRMRGDPGKLMRTTGWRPVTPLDVSLQDALVHWERSIDG